MAKKLPKGYSVKTDVTEVGLIDMYHWIIFKGDVQCESSFLKFDDRTEAREAGVKKLFERIETDAFKDY